MERKTHLPARAQSSCAHVDGRALTAQWGLDHFHLIMGSDEWTGLGEMVGVLQVSPRGGTSQAYHSVPLEHFHPRTGN